jgi:hypothetical protein
MSQLRMMSTGICRAWWRLQDDLGLLAKISKLIIDLDRDPSADHLVSLILDEMLEVLVPVDPTLWFGIIITLLISI